MLCDSTVNIHFYTDSNDDLEVFMSWLKECDYKIYSCNGGDSDDGSWWYILNIYHDDQEELTHAAIIENIESAAADDALLDPNCTRCQRIHDTLEII